jgi:hypothetical protein
MNPAALLLDFCHGPLLAFGGFLDSQITKMAGNMIVTIRDPNLEMR